MMFPRLYTDPPEQCPLAGYEGYSFRVLLNPTASEKRDWWLGGIGARDCEACAAARAANPPRPFCAACQERRDRWGRAWPAIYGTSHAAGLDFTSAPAALESITQEDLPDELLSWLIQLPDALWAARAEEIKKKLPTSSPTGNSTPTAG